MAKTFVEYFVGDDAHNVARKLRRRGFEVRVHGKVWLTVVAEGEYNATLELIRRAVVAYCLSAVPIDWGKLEAGR